MLLLLVVRSVCGYWIISRFRSYFFHSFSRFSNSIKGFLSIDIDVSELQVNQCNSPRSKEPLSANKYYNEIFSQIEIFHESNKCHSNTMVVSIFLLLLSFFCWIHTLSSHHLHLFFLFRKRQKKKLFCCEIKLGFFFFVVPFFVHSIQFSFCLFLSFFYVRRS